MHRILLVEDSPEIQVIVSAALGRDNELLCAGSCAEALAALKRTRFDLILLDVMLPDGNGFEICAKLKTLTETQDLPVIFLTGRTGVNEKVVGFSLGAEDYVTKPFDPIELKARVQARLAKLARTKHSAAHFVHGNLKFHLPSMTAHVSTPKGDQALALTALEFRLLHFFASNPEVVFTREQLLNSIWGESVHVIDRAVDGQISQLRKKIQDSHFNIKSVYGAGYRFTDAKASAKPKKRAS